MIDLDRQADLTKIYLPTDHSNATILDLLQRKKTIKEVLVSITENLSIIPESQDIDTFSFRYSKQVLSRYLKELPADTNIVLIDHPPALNSVTASAFAASDEVLIVSDCEPFSMQNLNYLLRDLETIQANEHPNLHILGILINRVDLRRKLSKRMLAAYRHTFGEVVFNSYISNDTAIPNSIDRKISLRQLNWQSRTIKQINCIIDEILKRLGWNSAE